VREKAGHLLVGQRLEHPLLQLQERQFQSFRVMPLGVQPPAEGVQRVDVSVARHRLHNSLAQLDDELLQ